MTVYSELERNVGSKWPWPVSSYFSNFSWNGQVISLNPKSGESVHRPRCEVDKSRNSTHDIDGSLPSFKAVRDFHYPTLSEL